MINLTEKDKEIIRRLGYPKIVNLSSGSYLVKSNYKNKGINEQISKKLADILGLVCPSYYLVNVDNESFVLSEDLNQYGEFISALEICEKYKDSNVDVVDNITDNSLYSVWAFIENSYPDATSKALMNEVLKMYIFDILFLNYDRDLKNWGILVQKDGTTNIVIFDNEFIFEQPEEDKVLMAETVALTSSINEFNPNTYEDFKRFIKDSSHQFIDLFKYYFDLITPDFLKGLIGQIERRDNIKIDTKDKLVEIYTLHRIKLLNIYEEEIKQGDNHAR